MTSKVMAEVAEYERWLGRFRILRVERRKQRARRIIALRELSKVQKLIHTQASLGRGYAACVVTPLAAYEALELGIRIDPDEVAVSWPARAVAFVLRGRGFDVARNGSTLYITWGGHEVQDYWSP